MVTRTSMLNRRTDQRFRQVAISAVGSVQIRMLLCCCTLFILFVLASRTPYLGWEHENYFPPESADRYSVPGKGYALLINTWKRNDLLKQSITHYSSCSGLDSIHIVWSEPNAPSDSLVSFLNHVVQSKTNSGRQIELKFDINKEDSLNNRFKEIKDMKVDAVFSIDDDIIFPCSSVELAFSVWRSAPDAMVGFVPRIHWVDQSKGNKNHFTYGGWWSVWWMGRYSMVLSKAAFFHKKYLSLYTNEMPASIREYTTKSRNCEDIAMSFLVANVTGAPPIWVKVAKRSSIFDDPLKDIQELTALIKDDITALNIAVSDLQTLQNMEMADGIYSEDRVVHTTAVFDDLKNKLMGATKQFQNVLTTRTENIKAHENRKQIFSTNMSRENPLRQQPNTVTEPPPWASSSNSSGSSQLSQSPPSNAVQVGNQLRRRLATDNTPSHQMEVSMLQQVVPRQENYSQSRAVALQNVESTISEVSGIFTNLATMVVEQGEMAIRIDDNMEESLANVEGARSSLLKHLNKISSNRWLLIKIFAILIFFLIIFIFFLA